MINFQDNLERIMSKQTMSKQTMSKKTMSKQGNVSYNALSYKALINDEMFEKAYIKATKLISEFDYEILKKEYEKLNEFILLKENEYDDDDCIEKASISLAFIRVKKNFRLN